ncbi:acyl carrier protein [Pontibacterium sp. N1Y112]|uniref:Acyl carrier protein n=1 Tax=Pontibacterium sinense TaxID=2781979 RepID=A0A8J7FBV7_9GAMM|nr:acyl carrier protein [Pontibacterium sinense]MBE9398087.1 acyl carrier protein [Pontibacterium sinense]
MKQEQIDAIVFEELQNIAPELEPDTLDREEDLRDELDIDSMDFMILIIALGKRLNIRIPDTDHHLLNSINNLLAYLYKSAA